MKKIAKRICISVVLWVLGVAGLIVFGTVKSPPPAPNITQPFSAIDYSALPPLDNYRTRDGAQLSYRKYPAGEQHVAVLIHGSAGSSGDMHLLASVLQGAGVTVYVPDLRGHGANRPHGDIAYVGQLDEDMADFMAIKKSKNPDADWTLVGFSSGGGFALRIAAEKPLGQAFSQYILLSPYLKYNAPSTRVVDAGAKSVESGTPQVKTQQWAAVSTGRIIGLSILNFFGVHHWDGLPVITFSVPPEIASVTRSYSWRLLQNFQPHDDYLADIRAVARPMHVYVGAADEILDAENLRNEFQAQRSDIPVRIIPGTDHSEMITGSGPIRAIVDAMLSQPGEPAALSQ